MGLVGLVGLGGTEWYFQEWGGVSKEKSAPSGYMAILAKMKAGGD